MKRAAHNDSKDEMVLHVKLNREHVLDLNADLAIEKSIINTELSKQPALYAWYATLHELAKDKVNTVKQELDLLEAELDGKIRVKAIEDSIKMTNPAIEAAIKTTLSHKIKHKQYTDAMKEAGLLMVAKAAFDQRKDMLISIASNMRNELDDDLAILKKKAHDNMTKK